MLCDSLCGHRGEGTGMAGLEGKQELELISPCAGDGLVDPGLIPGWEDPLEMGMATHSSILAWRIPWTEEPGGLQPMGS